MLLVNGNFFFKTDQSPLKATIGGRSVNGVSRQFTLFLIFLFLLFKTLLGLIFFIRKPSSIRFSYRKFFLKQFTIQRAPMAHRQWSQEQYGVRGFFFKIRLLSGAEGFSLTHNLVHSRFGPSVTNALLRSVLAQLSPFVILFSDPNNLFSRSLGLIYFLTASAALLTSTASSLLPLKSAQFSLLGFGGFLR